MEGTWGKRLSTGYLQEVGVEIIGRKKKVKERKKEWDAVMEGL